MRTLFLLTMSTVAVSAQCPFQGPVTGQAVPSMAALDQVMQCLLWGNNIPGATLAVSYNGALVYARGFGFADVASSTPA